MEFVRTTAVAGAFYPSEPEILSKDIQRYIEETPSVSLPVPKAIIVPHAGYEYSAGVAASAYKLLKSGRKSIKKVVILAPSHKIGFNGMALTKASAYETPLGNVEIDKEMNEQLLALPLVDYLEEAHKSEHSLEVQLPFLKEALDDFKLIPVITGNASPTDVETLLETVWGKKDTLIVISTDLSHYLPYNEACILDNKTKTAIENLDIDSIEQEQACGYVPLKGMLTIAKAKKMQVETLEVKNSGDTSGSKNRVVGYGAWAFLEK